MNLLRKLTHTNKHPPFNPPYLRAKRVPSLCYNTPMSWNYRLFKQDSTPEQLQTAIKAKFETGPLFFVGECYYDETNKPELHSSMDHNLICGDSVKETKEAFDMIAEAFNAPVIELDAEGNFK